MRKNVLHNLSILLAYVFIIVVCALVGFDVNTGLAEQGAVGGDALEDASMFPMKVVYLIVCLLIIDVVHFQTSGAKGNNDGQEPVKASGTRRSIFMIVGTCIFLLLLEPVGFVLLTPIYLGFLFRLLGVAKVLTSFLSGILATAILYFVFQNLLNVILPIGLLRILG